MKQRAVSPIELHIEELVLHGIPLRDRQSISEHVSQELQRLVLERGLPSGFARDVELPHLRGTEIKLAGSPVAANVGSEIARSIYASFSGTSRQS